MTRDGIVLSQVTSGSAATVPSSWFRTYLEPNANGTINTTHAPRLLTDSKRDGGARQLFSISLMDHTAVRQHTDGSSGSSAFTGAVSPDGALIAAAAQHGDHYGIAILPFAQDRANSVLQAPLGQNCRYESPTWLPDGAGLVFAAHCAGTFAIYRAEIAIPDPVFAVERPVERSRRSVAAVALSAELADAPEALPGFPPPSGETPPTAPALARRLEREANAFAAAVLMPAELIERAVGEFGPDVQRLAQRFAVSQQAMRYRLQQLLFLPPPSPQLTFL